MIKLPIPVIGYEGKDVIGFNLRKIPGGAIADTRKAAETNSYLGIHEWNSGCLESFVCDDDSLITDRDEIRKISRQTPFESAMYIGIQGAIFKSVDDGIEGIYECPMCHTKIKAEKKFIDGEEIDTRDFINQLPINIMQQPYSKTWTVELSEPVVLQDKRTGETLNAVENMTFHHVTLGDCIRVFEQNPNLIDDRIRFQYAVWVEALEQVNGKPQNKASKSMYGMPIFERITDFDPFKMVPQYGIDPMVVKTCPKCRKEFKVEINTANFFGSGLK